MTAPDLTVFAYLGAELGFTAAANTPPSLRVSPDEPGLTDVANTPPSLRVSPDEPGLTDVAARD